MAIVTTLSHSNHSIPGLDLSNHRKLHNLTSGSVGALSKAAALSLSNHAHSIGNLDRSIGKLDRSHGKLNERKDTLAPLTSDTVLFNIGGQLYRISRSLLNLQPKSMLARSASEHWHSQHCDNNIQSCQGMNAIFIDRNGSRFQYVLDYLRDGRIFLPMSECREAILSELDYYNIQYEEEYILHAPSTQGVAMNGMRTIQNTILKWKCADLAADIVEAAWNSAKWTGKEGDKKYLSLKPLRFKELCFKLNEKDVIRWTNEHLMTLGLKMTSLEFDLSCDRCRVTLQVVENIEL